MRLACHSRASRRQRSPRIRCCGSCCCRSDRRGCTVGIRHVHGSCAICLCWHCRRRERGRGRSRRRLLQLLRSDVREATGVATGAGARILERETVRLHVIGGVRMAAPLAFLHARARFGSLPTAAHGRLGGGTGSGSGSRNGKRGSRSCRSRGARP